MLNDYSDAHENLEPIRSLQSDYRRRARIGVRYLPKQDRLILGFREHHSNHRDGQGRIDANYGGLPHYEPNNFGQWQEQPQYKEPPLKRSFSRTGPNYVEPMHSRPHCQKIKKLPSHVNTPVSTLCLAQGL